MNKIIAAIDKFLGVPQAHGRTWTMLHINGSVTKTGPKRLRYLKRFLPFFLLLAYIDIHAEVVSPFGKNTLANPFYVYLSTYSTGTPGQRVISPYGANSVTKPFYMVNSSLTLQGIEYDWTATQNFQTITSTSVCIGAVCNTAWPDTDLTGVAYSTGVIPSSATGTYPLSITGTAASDSLKYDKTGGPISGSVQIATNTSIAGSLTLNDNLYVSSMANVNSFINTNEAYQIDGSTVVAIKGTNGLMLGDNAGPKTTGARNTFVGSQAGAANTTGLWNVFIGGYAGNGNISGQDNVIIGASAGDVNTNSYNTFLGSNAGGANTGGNYNVFVGHNSGLANIGGDHNTFLGQGAGQANTEGDYVTIVGNSAGNANTVANYGTFVGAYAGWSNTTGAQNIFMGFRASQYNTTGSDNTFLGTEAGWNNGSAGTGNTMVGTQAGRANVAHNTYQSSNTVVGSGAGYSFGQGANDNTLLGYHAGYTVTTGTGNIIIGANADVVAGGDSNKFIVGQYKLLSGDMTQSSPTLTVNGDLIATGNITGTCHIAKYTNADLVAHSSGTMVSAKRGTGFTQHITTTAANTLDVLGAIQDVSCVAGAVCSVGIGGYCTVLLDSAETCPATDNVVLTGTEIGRAACDTTTSIPDHFQEIGQPHTLPMDAGGTIKATLHFN